MSAFLLVAEGHCMAQVYLSALIGIDDEPPAIYFAVRSFSEQMLIDHPIRFDEAASHCIGPRRAPAITCSVLIHLQRGHLTSDLCCCIV